MSYVSTKDLSAELGLTPHKLTDLFYRQVLSESRCQRIAGRRAIPRSYVAEIIAILRARGVLSAQPEITTEVLTAAEPVAT